MQELMLLKLINLTQNSPWVSSFKKHIKVSLFVILISHIMFYVAARRFAKTDKSRGD